VIVARLRAWPVRSWVAVVVRTDAPNMAGMAAFSLALLMYGAARRLTGTAAVPLQGS
jgi:hypothetical protein